MLTAKFFLDQFKPRLFQLILCLLSFSFFGLFAYQYELAICAVFRDEAPYLKEWIEFHKIVGVQHFYLYNNLSNDDYMDVLHPYIIKGEVDLFDWPYESTDQTVWGPIQCSSYVHALKLAKGTVKWVAILDIDEFLFPTEKKKLTQLLKKYENYGGLVVNWLMYGTSGIEKIPDNQTLIETLNLRADTDWGENAHVKSIVRPERVILDWTTGWTPHNVTYRESYYAVNSNFNAVPAFISEPILIDKIRINHYWTRDEYYFHHYKLKRRQKWLDGPSGSIEKAKNLNKISDTTIFRFVPKLRKNLGLSKNHIH
jgi:hypothetical protein